jgi:hypothetical protein
MLNFPGHRANELDDTITTMCGYHRATEWGCRYAVQPAIGQRLHNCCTIKNQKQEGSILLPVGLTGRLGGAYTCVTWPC